MIHGNTALCLLYVFIYMEDLCVYCYLTVWDQLRMRSENPAETHVITE